MSLFLHAGQWSGRDRLRVWPHRAAAGLPASDQARRDAGALEREWRDHSPSAALLGCQLLGI